MSFSKGHFRWKTLEKCDWSVCLRSFFWSFVQGKVYLLFYILFSVQFIAMHFIILFYFYVCSCKIKLKLTCMSVYSGPAGFSLYYKFLVFFSVIIFIFYDPVVILSQIVTVNHKSLSITNESKMSLYVTRQLILRQMPKFFITVYCSN